SAGTLGLPYNPFDWQNFEGKFFVTTKDGIKYQIDGRTGKLESVTDRNDNTLSFSEGGIVSSAGPAITFQRDAQDRITAVTDPMGNSVRYEYDGNGDLVAVTDQLGSRTQFIYRATPAHYLDRVIDPLGRAGTRAEYSDQGLLVGLSNGNGST